MRDRVLTIHGIWTKGAWQEEVARVYEPHFECIPIKYSHYRLFGPLNLILEPFVLPVLGLVAISLQVWQVPFSIQAWSYGLLLVVAYLATYWRRTLAFDAVLKQASPYAHRDTQQNTHLIAHSLGTYLIGRALQQRDDFHIGRVVLVGCVLPQTFPWSELRTQGVGHAPKYLGIRNELARKDIVVYIAWLTAWLVRGLGIAGFSGFKGPSQLIHDVTNPSEACPSCLSTTGLVHNYYAKDLGHSGTFVGTGYAESFWLLFFWGIEPPEYAEFIDLCNAAAGLEREWSAASRASGHVDTRLIEIETRLRNSKWRWTGGTFEEYVTQEVKSRFPTSDQLLRYSAGIAIRGTWQLVRQAIEAWQLRADRERQGKPADAAADAAIAWRNPKEAVRRAVALIPNP